MDYIHLAIKINVVFRIRLTFYLTTFYLVLSALK